VRFLLLGNLLGSTTPLLFALVDAPGVWPSGVAMVLAGIALGAFAAASGRVEDLRLAVRMPGIWLVGVLVGVVTCAVASSVSFTSLVVATLLAQLTPVVTIALGPLFGERTTRGDYVAVSLAVAGALCLVRAGGGGGEHRSHLIGASLALSGAVGGALTLQLQRRFAADAVPAVAGQAVTLLVGGLAVLPFGAPPDVTPRRIGLVLTIGLVFAAANVLFFRGLRSIRASQAVAARPFGALFPIAAGPLALHQPLDILGAVGAALSVAATGVAALQSRGVWSRALRVLGNGAPP
jgi:drug/metabolite transporter (DMT)-like permease